jgi:hypothetical protein
MDFSRREAATGVARGTLEIIRAGRNRYCTLYHQ